MVRPNSCFTRIGSSKLARGQLWSTVAKDDDPYEVRLPEAQSTVTALGTQFDIACGLFETVLTVFEGRDEKWEARMANKSSRLARAPKIVDGAVTEKHRVRDLVIATSWVHEILKLKGNDNDELTNRLNHLFAQIGELKVFYDV